MSKTPEQLAYEYAAKRLERYDSITIWTVDVRNLMRDAYEQGWKDREAMKGGNDD